MDGLTLSDVVASDDDLGAAVFVLGGTYMIGCVRARAHALIVHDRAPRRGYDAGPERRVTLEDLIADPMRARELTSDEARALLIELAPVEKALQLAVLTSAPRPAPQIVAPEPDDLIDVGRVCEITHMTRRQVYNAARRGNWQSFVVRVNARVLRFRERGLRRWIVCQSGANT